MLKRISSLLAPGLAIFLWAGTSSHASAANPPGALPFSNISESQLEANWTDGDNLPGTTFYVILSTGPSPSTNGFAGNISIAADTSLSVLFTGLEPNTVYFAEVNATDPSDDSVSSFTDLGTVTTLTNPPGASAFSDITASQLQANWTANGNPDGTQYTAILSTADSPSTNGLAGNVPLVTTNLSAIFPSLQPNTLYFVDVQAEDGAFTSLGSTPTLANIPISASPSNVQTDEMTANWGSNGNPAGTSYNVQLSTSPTFSTLTASNNTTSTSLTFTGLSPNTNYFTQVRAVNEAGVATTFVVLPSTATPTMTPIPNGYTNISVSQVQANWEANGNPPETLYTVILSTASSPSTNDLAGNITSVTSDVFALFTGLATNTVYFADVKADGGPFVSLGSTPTWANQPDSAAPTTIGTNQFTVNWGAAGNPAGTNYLAELSTDSGFGTIVGSSSTFSTSTTFSGLIPNTLYFTHVKAVNHANISTPFTLLPSTITLAAAPGSSAFTGITNTQLQANWTSNGNPAGTQYVVQISTHSNFSTLVASSNTLNTSATFTSLTPNTTYYAQVRAINFGGTPTGFTPLSSALTNANLPDALPFSNVTTSQVQANWSDFGNPNDVSYTAVLSTGASPSTNGFSGNLQITTPQKLAVFIGLSVNTVYFAEVRAAASAFVTLGSTATLANAPGSAAFSNIQTTAFTANWTSAGNPAGTSYIVQISTDSGFGTLTGSSTTFNTFASFSGLISNTHYFARVQAVNRFGIKTSPTPLGSALTLSNAPLGAPFSNVTAAQIQANWTANGNPAGTQYTAILSTRSSPSTNGLAGNVPIVTTNLFAIFPSLLPNATYFVDVQAEGGPFTSLGSTPTLANLPTSAAPSSIQINQFTANWGANGNPAGTSYQVQLSTTLGFTNVIATSSTLTTSLTFTGLSANTVYFTRVRAGNFSGVRTAFFDLPSATTLAIVPGAGAFTGVTGSQVTANWTTNGNPAGTSYVAQLSTDPGFTTIVGSSNTLATSATFTALNPNTLYHGRVQAVNFAGTPSTFTALGSTTTRSNPPLAAPFSNISSTQIQANWSANGNPAGILYTVILSTGPSPSTNGLAGNISSSTTNTFALFTGLAVNRTYFADVRSVTSAYTALGSVPTLANEPASAAPSNIGINQIRANWGANGNPAGTMYIAQASVDSGFGVIAASTQTSSLFATFSGLLGNTLYFMHVQALNSASVATLFKDLPSTSTLENVPSAPGVAGFSAVTTSQLTANWTANGNGPTISYTAILSSAPSPSTNGLAGNQTVTNSTTSATFSGLSPNIRYFVDVRATSTGGSSPYSSLGSVPTLANPPIAASPTNIGINQITANWGTNGNPPGTTYRVEASTDALFGSIAAQMTVSASSAILTGLSANTHYFMQVQAFNLNSIATSFIGLPSATTLESVPNPPGSAAFSNITTSQVQANWTASGNPPTTSYKAILSTAASPSTNNLSSNQQAMTTNLFALYSGLTPNTLYFVDVNGTSNGGSSSYTSLGSIATLANAPASAALGAIGINQITANWGANSNPPGTQYLVEASTDSNFGSISTAVNTTLLSATLTGLSANTQYFLHVQAINQNSIGTAFTNLPSAVTLQNIPNPPGAAAFTGISTNQLTANWTANGNPSYVTYSAVLSSAPNPSSNGLPGNQIIPTTSFLATFSSLSPNVLYYVDVKAISNGGSSAYSGLGSVPTLAAQPTSLSPSNIQPNQITAHWGANGNSPNTFYLAQASLDPGFASITVAVSTTSLSAILTGLSPQTTYYMHVQAINQAAQATLFTPLPSAVTLSNPPNIPGSAGFTNVSATQVQANWIANGNPAGTQYTAILSTGASPSTNGFAGNQQIITTNLSAPFTGLSPNTLYYVQVKATNAGGDSAFADLGSVPTLANLPAPASPTGIQTNQITANWGTNSNPPGTQYLVQASPDAGFASIASAVNTTFSSATLTGLLANTTYFMRVRASNQIGTQTDFVPLPAATTLTTPPNVPNASGFSGIGINQLTANWTANGNPAGTQYTAILSTGASPSTNGFVGNQQIITTNLSAPFTGLSPNTLYFAAVKATSSGGNSAFTGLGSVPTLANPPAPASPTGIGTNQITANWLANGNPAGTLYTAQASPDSGFSVITSAVNTTNSSATLTGLLANTLYFMRVHASNQSAVPTIPVLLPQATTLTTPPNVPNAAGFTGIGNSQIQANWTANGNPAGTQYTAILSTGASPSTNGFAGNQQIITTNLFAPFTTLAPNTLYHVEVKATSSGGSSAFTGLGSVPTLANPPTPGSPTGIGTNQITANWTPNGNPAGTLYTVQASPDSGFSTITSAVNTINSSATLTGLLANTLYFMRVHASNQSAVPTAPVLLPQATTLTTPPGVPGAAGFSGIGTNQLTANWSANGNPAGTQYTAILSTGASPSTNGFAGNQQIITTNFFAPFTGLQPNTLYFVQVKASNAGGDSAFTDLGAVPTLANVPTAASPSGIQTNQITANWGTNSNPPGTHYLVQASPDPLFTSIASAVNTTNSSATLTGLLASTLYYMQVQASNQASVTTTFIALPQATTLTTPPNVPNAAGFTGINTNQLTANWTANGNLAGTQYTAILSTGASPSTNGFAGNQQIITTNLFALFTTLAPNTLYHVAVKATSSGGSSAFTGLGSVPTWANAPTAGLPTGIGTNQITANWTANGNPAGTQYTVQASPDSGFSTITSAVNTINSSATLTGLLANTLYFMRVQASNQASVATTFVPLPQATTLTTPPNVPTAAGFTGINTTLLTANWTANGNPAGTQYIAILSTGASPSTNGFAGNQQITTTNLFAPFTGLSPNTLYFVAVNATNGGGNSAFTSLGSAPTLANQPAPGLPTGIGTNQITANWTANGNPAGTLYTVQASPDSGFSTITSAVNTANSSATLTGLLPQTLYFMQVQAINQNAVATSFIPLPEATTLTTPPNVPNAAGFTGINTNQLTANWTANGNPAGTQYTAIRSTGASPSTNGFTGNQQIITTNLFAPFTGLSPNTFYFVEVKATSSGGSSAYTALGSVPTWANLPVAGQPTGVGTNQITANWTPNGNPAGTLYTAQASPDSGFSVITSAVNTTLSSATLTGLLSNTLYFMRVQAANAASVSTDFIILPSTKTRENLPSIPAGAGFSAITTSQLQAHWTANGNAAGTTYTTILSTASSPNVNGLSGNQQITTTNTNATFSALSPNTLYFVEVKASNGGGSSAYADIGSAATLANAPNSATPTGIAASSVTANWTANGNPIGTTYRIQVSLISDFSFISIVRSTTSLSITFTGLTPDTTYYMQVQAVNQTGSNTSFTPLPAVITLGNPPVAPGAATFSNITTNQLQANWTPNGNPSGTFYQAILSSAPSPGTNGLSGNQSTNGNGTFAIFAGLSPNTLYYADVQASNLNGSSIFTSLGQAATLANAPTPASPTSVGANQFTANWGPNGNPAGTVYRVQASLDSGFATIAVTNTSTNTFSTLIGLSPNTTYYTHVQAINQNFVSTAFTDLPSTTTLANAPAIPVPLGFTNVTTNHVQANWTANGNPAGTLFTVVFSTGNSPSSNGLPGNQTTITTGTVAVFTGLTPNTIYFADVKASNATGVSGLSSLGSVVTLASAPVSASPTNIGADHITANWGANGNPLGTLYFVQASLASNFSSLIDASVTGQTSFAFIGLSGNTTYYMRVAAINQAAQQTAFTILPPAQTVVILPGGPVLAATQITDSTITWTWASVPNATGYRVLTENAVNVSGDLPSSILEWQEAGLAVNTSYSRRLEAFNASGSSTSLLVTAFTLAHQPTGLSVQSITSDSITLNWNANGNPVYTQYVARISPASPMGSSITVTGLQVTFEQLEGATTYFFTVQAVNGAGAAASGNNSLSATTLPQLVKFQQICPSGASALAFNGPKGQVRVEIPAGAFASCVQFTVKIPGTFPNAPSSGTPLEGTGVGIELTNDLSLQPLLPITVTVPFTSADVTSSQSQRLVLARYDSEHNAWVMLPTTVNSEGNAVTAQTDHLSLYQIMVALPAGDLSAARVYPNPFRPALGHTIVNFVNLPVDASIQIYTITGEKVQDVYATPTGTAYWYGNNQSGQAVASGVYFAVVKSGSAKTILKVAVQR